MAWGLLPSRALPKEATGKTSSKRSFYEVIQRDNAKILSSNVKSKRQKMPSLWRGKGCGKKS